MIANIQVTNGPTIRSLPSDVTYSMQLSTDQQVFNHLINHESSYVHKGVEILKTKKQVEVDSVVSRFHNLTFHLWAASPGRIITGLGQGFKIQYETT